MRKEVVPIAWSTPLTAVANAALTASQWNASVRDNLLETATAKATTAGAYHVATGVNSVAQRILGFDSIPTSETTAATVYSHLATVGPTVTVTSGPQCLGLHTAKMANNAVGGQTFTALDITGATTVGPTDNLALQFNSAIANASYHASYVVVYAVTSGSNTFQMKYNVNTGTGTFLYRRLTILPY